MYAVTQAFLDQIRASVRHVLGRVQIDYTDPFLDQSVTVTASEQAAVSFPGQTADAVTDTAYQWASLDGSWLLDGLFHLAPATEEEAKTIQMGWWGSQLADVDGAFAAPYPALTVSHFARPVHDLRVVGDSARGEYPVDFAVGLYAADGTLLYSKAVTGNSQVAWLFTPPTPILDVTRQVLTVTRWSHPGRQVKIVEFFTSVQEVYEGDDLLSVSLLEEREVSQGSLPVGNISANEIQVRLNNIDHRFDAGNTQSPLFRLLKQNRRIHAWLGVRYDDGNSEFAPLGVFWSGDWRAPENDVYAETSGRDRLELLRVSTYSVSQVAQNVTLYDLAAAVLQDAGLTSAEYWVDPELQQYPVPYAWFEPQSHREALRLIAEACLGQVYCDREGIIRVEGPSFLATNLTPVLQLTADDYFAKDNPVQWSQIANSIEVTTQPLRPSAAPEEVYRSNEPVSIGAGETTSLTVYYNQAPCIEALASIADGPAGCAVTAATYYAWGTNVTIYSPVAGAFTLVVNAKPLTVLNQERATAEDAASITDNGRLRYSFPDNPLVQTLAMAQAIADGLLASFKDPRRDAELDWRGNPALLLGDRVSVVDRNEQNDYFAVRQELEYDGGLIARMSGRRAP